MAVARMSGGTMMMAYVRAKLPHGLASLAPWPRYLATASHACMVHEIYMRYMYGSSSHVLHTRRAGQVDGPMAMCVDQGMRAWIKAELPCVLASLGLAQQMSASCVML